MLILSSFRGLAPCALSLAILVGAVSCAPENPMRQAAVPAPPPPELRLPGDAFRECEDTAGVRHVLAGGGRSHLRCRWQCRHAARTRRDTAVSLPPPRPPAERPARPKRTARRAPAARRRRSRKPALRLRRPRP